MQTIGGLDLRDVSVLGWSLGDGQVGGPYPFNDGKNRAEFTPHFPSSYPRKCSSCPKTSTCAGVIFTKPSYQMLSLSAAISPGRRELVGAKGGGVSTTTFPKTWYQFNAVDTYLYRDIKPEVKEDYTTGAYVKLPPP